jgi:hypothetical protein
MIQVRPGRKVQTFHPVSVCIPILPPLFLAIIVPSGTVGPGTRSLFRIVLDAERQLPPASAYKESKGGLPTLAGNWLEPLRDMIYSRQSIDITSEDGDKICYGDINEIRNYNTNSVAFQQSFLDLPIRVVLYCTGRTKNTPARPGQSSASGPAVWLPPVGRLRGRQSCPS